VKAFLPDLPVPAPALASTETQRLDPHVL